MRSGCATVLAQPSCFGFLIVIILWFAVVGFADMLVSPDGPPAHSRAGQSEPSGPGIPAREP